jgi:hypothetical protein
MLLRKLAQALSVRASVGLEPFNPPPVLHQLQRGHAEPERDHVVELLEGGIDAPQCVLDLRGPGVGRTGRLRAIKSGRRVR